MSGRPSLFELLDEIATLSVGLMIVLLPVMILSIPGVVLFVVLPAILLGAVVAIPLALAALLAGPPYLLIRLLRRRHGLRP